MAGADGESIVEGRATVIFGLLGRARESEITAEEDSGIWRRTIVGWIFVRPAPLAGPLSNQRGIRRSVGIIR